MSLIYNPFFMNIVLPLIVTVVFGYLTIQEYKIVDSHEKLVLFFPHILLACLFSTLAVVFFAVSVLSILNYLQ